MRRLLGQRPQSAPPATIELTGVVRDFAAYGDPGGHPTMERPNKPNALGPRWVIGNLVEPILGSDRKPVFSNNGIIVLSPWKDAAGRNIAMQLPPAPGDVPGVVTNAWNDYLDVASFPELFNDVPGVNLSVPLTITLNLQGDGTYLFDADNDPAYSGGFFPINSRLLGNYSGGRNYHFSFELHAEFEYVAGIGQIFEFNGDDDVWVFVDDKLVVDLGGRHSAKSIFVDMDRLGLTDGESYRFDFFLMERRTSGSHCKITTNLPLETAKQVSSVNPCD
jgi:fibro-slime domain-containing protein